jgi:DNA-binding transcriptional LysR family regulator
MELRHLRYFFAVAEEQHFGRAAVRLRVAQPALSRQIQDLEREIGFELFDRLPRGVKLNAAGTGLLEDMRRIFQEISAAGARAKRVASGQSGTLNVGYVQSLSWMGPVPEALRRFREHRPDAELQLSPMSSFQQVPLVRSGSLDAGFVYGLGNIDPELAQFQAGEYRQLLAIPVEHPLAQLGKIRLKDLVDARFICFPRHASPNWFDRLMADCARGGLTAPKIVQESPDESAMLGMVACGIGVAFVSSASKVRHPPNVTLLPVADLRTALPFYMVWRKENNSPLLAHLVADVKEVVGRSRQDGETCAES